MHFPIYLVIILSFLFEINEIDQGIPTVFDVVQQVHWLQGTYEGLDRHPGEDESVFGELGVTLLAYSQITQRPCFLRSSMGASMGIQISGNNCGNKSRLIGRALPTFNERVSANLYSCTCFINCILFLNSYPQSFAGKICRKAERGCSNEFPQSSSYDQFQC